jgi:hypothetical protein
MRVALELYNAAAIKLYEKILKSLERGDEWKKGSDCCGQQIYYNREIGIIIFFEQPHFKVVHKNTTIYLNKTQTDTVGAILSLPVNKFIEAAIRNANNRFLEAVEAV